MRARGPTLGEDIDDYRRDLAVQGKKLLPDDDKYRRVQYRRLDNVAFEAVEPDLLKRITEYGRSNDSAPANGPLREIVEANPDNGQKMVRFLGKRSFVHDFKSPVRYVTSFTTDRGRWMPQRGWF
jgi:hypothetical protein